MLKTRLAAGVLVAACVSLSVSASAAGDAPTDRQKIMGNVGKATGVLGDMAKGQTAFDAVAAQMAMRTLNNASLAFGYMFPEGSETGANTEASPKIWSDRAGFDAAVAKFIADTSAEITDEASFKAAFGAAASNCGACHKAYRIKN